MNKELAPVRRPSLLASFLIVALLAALAATIPAFTNPAQAACKMTPEGQVLAMSNNIYETQLADAKKFGDLKKFVRRMKEKAPGGYAPDFALLQEGRKVSMAKVARFMTRKFGCTYKVDKRATASKSGWTWLNKYWKLHGEDTAVVYNANSMLLRGAGLITHDYNREDAAPRESVKVKESAWLKLVEKDIPAQSKVPLTVVAASVHFPRGTDFDGDATNSEKKREFAEQLASSLERIQPLGPLGDPVIHVIAGDFNMPRYEGRDKSPTPTYRTLTSRAYPYSDGPIEHASGAPNPIDFLFATGRHIKAGFDANNTHNEGSRKFYSNHDLRWSLMSACPATGCPAVD
jgi:hypothetical protein